MGSSVHDTPSGSRRDRHWVERPLALPIRHSGNHIVEVELGRVEDGNEWELRVVAGPDSGRVIPLGPGVTVIGGSDCRGGVCVADPAMRPFHAVIEVGPQAAELQPLADRRLGRKVVMEAESFRLGDSIMWLARADRPAVTIRPSPGCPVVHHRPPRVRVPSPPSAPREVEEPPPLAPTSVASPAPALIGAAVTAVIAVALRQPVLVLLGLSGSVVAVATWAHARMVRRRDQHDRERAADERARRRAEVAASHRRSVVRHHRLHTDDICRATVRALSDDPTLWQRRTTHDDAWRVVVGVGDRFEDEGAPVDETPPTLREVPVEVNLAPGVIVGISGDRAAARALVRSLITQLVASVGPADLALELDVSEDATPWWQWLAELPHRVSPPPVSDVAASQREPSDAVRHTVRVVDSDRVVATTRGRGAVIVIVDHPSSLPENTSARGDISSSGTLRWFNDATTHRSVAVTSARCPLERATSVARALTDLVDPEDCTGERDESIDLAALLPEDVEELFTRWHSAGDDPPPRAVIGRNAQGHDVEIDLARDGPHAVIGGTTGSGKSELLRTLVVGLATSSPPSALAFVLVDFKGGAAFDSCLRLPHVVGVLTDLEAAATGRALLGLDAELKRRERLLREVGAGDLTAYRRSTARPQEAIARLVIVVDEFASLAAEMPDALRALVAVAQRGRSLGVHLVLATQRPAGAVSDDIRANTSIRISLRVATIGEAIDLVGDARAAHFPRDRPGTALVRLGADEPIAVRTASMVDGAAADPANAVPVDALSSYVDLVVEAARRRPEAPPHRPWTTPLPEHAGPEWLLHPHDHGVLDDPGGQVRRPLRWDPTTGHLAVVGAIGSGCTSTLQTVVRQTIAARPDVDVHVVDSAGDSSWDELASADAVGSVIRLHERERVVRLVDHAANAVVSRRRDRQVRSGVVLVAIDGMGGFRRALDGEGPEVVARWDQVVADGPAVGVVVATTADHASALPLSFLAHTAQRWMSRLADPLDASMLGAPTMLVPDATAPSGRMLCLPARLQAQVLAPGAHAPAHPSVRPTRPILTLPDDVVRGRLPRSDATDRGVRLWLGLGAEDLEPVCLVLRPGDHVVIVGPPGTGRTSALTTIARAWAEATGTTAATLDDLVDGGEIELARSPTFVIVDDADRIDDDGRLERLATAGMATFAVAMRTDRQRGSFGHWTSILRRCRTGLVLGVTNADAIDVFGVVLPRRPWIPDRPGRGWLIAHGEVLDLVQLASTDRRGVPCGSDLVLERTALRHDGRDALGNHGLVRRVSDIGEKRIGVGEDGDDSHRAVRVAQTQIPHHFVGHDPRDD